MPGIAQLTVEQFQTRINRFDQKYVQDWDQWCNALRSLKHRAPEFGRILRRWQACRPNPMRRSQYDSKAQHGPPFLEDLIFQAVPHLQVLQDFDIRLQSTFTAQVRIALERLWTIFEDLSYPGPAKTRNGRAGVVGISKAILLLTEGRVGPAFDSEVRRHLQITNIHDSQQWIQSLLLVSRDIQAFEQANKITLQQAAPRQYGGLHSGRIYDMALGPGKTDSAALASNDPCEQSWLARCFHAMIRLKRR